jgi:branched-chain amino acid transport system substrate-binding protein
MEVKRIYDAGGINGRKIEVLIEDDGTDETKAVAAVTKLIDQDKVVAILGTTGTGTTMAIRSAIDKAGIPEVSMAGGNAVTGKFDPLVFQTAWSNALVIPYELAYMKKHGITKIGLISDPWLRQGWQVAHRDIGCRVWNHHHVQPDLQRSGD